VGPPGTSWVTYTQRRTGRCRIGAEGTLTLLGLEIVLSLVVAFLAGAVLVTLLLERGAPRGAAAGGWPGPLAVLALLALLALVCVPLHAVAIAAGLARSSAALLGGQGLSGRVDGRDLTLSGTVPSEQAKAEAAARVLAQPGVRTVTNLLEVAAPPPPAPAPAAAAVQARLTTLLEARRIEFEPSSAVLTAASLPLLEEVRAVLAGAPDLSIRVEGHTDDRGDPAANRALSQARAEAVVDWLAAHGVERGRLAAQGFGPDRPLTANDTAAGRARNRRVDLLAR